MMFSYILSSKVRPREFMDPNFFHAGYEKSEIDKKTKQQQQQQQSTKRL